MPAAAAVPFLIVVLSIYLLIHIYLLRRLRQAFKHKPRFLRDSAEFAIIFAALLYPVSRSAAALLPADLGGAMLKWGAIYLGWLFYMLMGLLLRDLWQVGQNRIIKHTKTPLLQANSFLFLCTIAALITGAGILRASQPQTVIQELSFDKKLPIDKPLHLLFAADLHLDESVPPERLQKWVKRMNQQQADAIFLVGDILDGHQPHRLYDRFGETLHQLHSRYGVYVVPGNHEYYVGIDSALSFFRSCGMIVLRDSTLIVDNAFAVVGRDDQTHNAFYGKRKSLADLLQNIDRSLPIIVLDHQPVGLQEAADEAVDLQVSGHTHNGQLFPLNWITRLSFKNSYGLSKKGTTYFYVTCGLGTWGPPIRTTSRPEIVLIRIDSLPQQ